MVRSSSRSISREVRRRCGWLGGGRGGRSVVEETQGHGGRVQDRAESREEQGPGRQGLEEGRRLRPRDRRVERRRQPLLRLSPGLHLRRQLRHRRHRFDEEYCEIGPPFSWRRIRVPHR